MSKRWPTREENERNRQFYEVLTGKPAPGPPPYMFWQRILVVAVLVLAIPLALVFLGWARWSWALIPLWIVLSLWMIMGKDRPRA